jgi:Winged helix DNA-binding domain
MSKQATYGVPRVSEESFESLVPMNLVAIANNRLINQQIEQSKCETPKEVVDWMGAMQAQDYAMAKWAIGVRLPEATDRMIETAMSKGEIIRTHLLRPTWHIVSADDIYWMLALRATRIKAAMRPRFNQLGLTEDMVVKSNQIMEKALRGGKNLTREEILPELTKAGIPVDENRASHLLMWAELDGLVCSGATKGKKLTYALLEERVPKADLPSTEEALAKLAKKYYSSHGPATVQDFAWWSGLSAKEASHALELVKSNFKAETINGQTYWYLQVQSPAPKEKKVVTLLPAFDEFIISYTDRGAALPFENFNKAVSNNGIFRPIVVVNGQVTGIWKRTIQKGKVVVETEFFQPPEKTTLRLIEEAARRYGNFLGMETEFSMP